MRAALHALPRRRTRASRAPHGGGRVMLLDLLLLAWCAGGLWLAWRLSTWLAWLMWPAEDDDAR